MPNQQTQKKKAIWFWFIKQLSNRTNPFQIIQSAGSWSVIVLFLTHVNNFCHLHPIKSLVFFLFVRDSGKSHLRRYWMRVTIRRHCLLFIFKQIQRVKKKKTFEVSMELMKLSEKKKLKLNDFNWNHLWNPLNEFIFRQHHRIIIHN